MEQSGAASGPGGTLAELGMNTAEAMVMLETVLAMKCAGQLVVSTGNLGERIDQWVKLDSLHSQPSGAGPTVTRSARSPASAWAPGEAPRDETELRIAQIWQDVLGIECVGIHDHFAALGGHSLLAIRIVSELRRTFEMDLPVRALFDAPTIAALSSHIMDRLASEIEGLSDEEARQLVANG
jgi:acyl carrier protein